MKLPKLSKTEQITDNYVNQYHGDVAISFITNPEKTDYSIFRYYGEEYTLTIPITQVRSSITFRSNSVNSWTLETLVNYAEC